MSAWRRVALKTLPAHSRIIEAAESWGMLWEDLLGVFQKAHKDPIDEKTIRAVYELAWWAVSESRSGDLASTAICAFYEELPTNKLVVNSLPLHVTRDQFLGLQNLFKYHLSPAEHRAFVDDFLKRRERVDRLVSNHS